MKFFHELRRRSVFRVAGLYAVVSWLLIQIVVAIKAPLGLPSWTDTFFIVLLGVGFPIALVLAWAFELTPEGMKPTKSLAAGETPAPRSNRVLDYVILAGFAAVAAMIVWQTTRPAPSIAKAGAPVQAAASKTADAASIAVLPFEDLSPKGDQGYFADGMAEEILNVLANVPGISVASRTSSFQFKGREIGVPEIAKQLNVRHILEGSVRKAGATVRITAQLIDTKSDRHLWSETFDRPLTTDDVFTIQDQIAQAIVNAMDKIMGVKTAPTITVAPATDNLTAYDLYLQARPLFQARVNLREADALLARAVEQDPKFVKAWEMRAAIAGVIDDYGGTGLPPAENYQQALKFVDQALQLDPMSATAIAVRALVHQRESEELLAVNDRGAIIADLEKALEIDPRNPGAFNWLGLAYADVGDLQHSLQAFEKCLADEPYYAACAENRVILLGAMGRDKEAYEFWKAEINVGAVQSFSAPLAVFARLGEEMAFKLTFNASENFYGYRRQDEVWLAYRTGKHDEELAADLLRFARARNLKIPQGILGNFIQPIGAYDLIPLGQSMWDAAYAGYRRSPQFKNWIRKSGVEKYWRAKGFPPQCEPVGNDDFECK